MLRNINNSRSYRKITRGIISFFHSIFHNFGFHDNKGGNSTNPAAHYLRQSGVFSGEVRHFFFFKVSCMKFIIQWMKSEGKSNWSEASLLVRWIFCEEYLLRLIFVLPPLPTHSLMLMPWWVLPTFLLLVFCDKIWHNLNTL